MYTPTTIANYFIENHSYSDDMTPMKVIKLVYLSYCWYIALTDNNGKLIDEQPEAWDFGPVFPSLYHDLKKYGKSKITEKIPGVLGRKQFIDDLTITMFLDKMWDMYGKFNGVYLSALTHKIDTPWQTTYENGKNKKISDELIFNHYKNLLLPRPDKIHQH